MTIAKDLAVVTVPGSSVVYLGGEPLGHTVDDGAVIRYTPDLVDVMADDFGTSLIRQVLQGEAVEAEFVLAQYDKEVVAASIPAGDFADPSGSGSYQLGVGKRPGFDLGSVASELILRPQGLDDGTAVSVTDFDIVIFKAVCADVVEIPQRNSEQFKLAVTFRGYIEDTRTDGVHLFAMGQETP